MKLTTRDEKEIYYEIFEPTTEYQAAGKPPHPLLLIHGLGADRNMWRPQIETYPELGFRLIVPDMRGHGRSSLVESLEISDWSEDLRELLDHLGVEKATVVGVSMGGVIAQSFAVHYPERATRLIICDSFCELSSFGDKFKGVFALAGLYPFKLFGKEALAKAVGSAYTDPEVKQYFIEVTRRAELDQIILARKAINKVDYFDELRSLRLPALVLVGTNFGESFVAMSRKIAEAIPGARFHALENAGDPSNLVNTEAFDREVLEFLRDENRLDQT
jgi:pimeloyl-ACP methyl ester carboxylesterase